MEPIHILSLGAGVQSSTLALMAAAGEIGPMPTAAIFADTQAEPESVYKWLAWLEKQLPFPVHRVSCGDLGKESIRLRVSKKTGQTYCRNLLPAYVKKSKGGHSLMGRKCTAEFKVRELTKKTRQLIGASKIRAWHKSPSDALAKIWIGISLDEIQRIKPSQEPWKESIWPLIERRMSRHDCLNWMRANGFPEPPRSACIWCPFHSDEEWIRQKNEEPDEWRKSVEFDRELRLAAGSCTGTAKLRGEVFLHASLVPLNQVQFGKVKSHAQLDLFQNECTGMCGV